MSRLDRACSQCNKLLGESDVICIDCGFDLRDGVYLTTENSVEGDTRVHSGNPYLPPAEPPEGVGQHAGASFAVNAFRHVLMALIATFLGCVIHVIVFLETLTPGQLYTYMAFEFALPSFLLGAYFSETAKFPIRGFIGVAIGYWLVLALDGFGSEGIGETLIASSVASFGVSIFPAICEVAVVVSREFRCRIAIRIILAINSETTVVVV